MTKTTKIVVGILAIVLIIWAIMWRAGTPASPAYVAPGASNTQTSQFPPTGRPAPVTTQSVSNTSDASLNQDAAAIDGQMSALNADSASSNPTAQ